MIDDASEDQGKGNGVGFWAPCIAANGNVLFIGFACPVVEDAVSP